MNDKVSVLIPARNEPYLNKTIDGIFKSAKGDIEVIVVLDGYWPEENLIDNPKLIVIHHTNSLGMRHSINDAVNIATGKYIMKCDAHCIFIEGFDELLKKDCEPNWAVVPVRHNLEPVKWVKGNKTKEFQYIRYPDLKGKDWQEYGDRVKDQKIVDLMTTQGSCWFMHRDYFIEIDKLDDVNYGGMGREAQEICLKVWLSGGRFVLNRNVWYAHWDKDSGLYKDTKDQKTKSEQFATDFWVNNKWPKQKMKLTDLVNKFHPVPTWEGNYNFIDDKSKLLVPEIKKENNGNFHRDELFNMFHSMGLKNGAEIGVYSGRNAQRIFRCIPGCHLFLIDPYEDFSTEDCKEKEFAIRVRKRAEHRVGKFNHTFIKKLSEDAAKDIPDGSLDFVYIDTYIVYDCIMLDLILWNRKVRKGGIVSGCSYGYDIKHSQVSNAVDDYVKIHNIKDLKITDPCNLGRRGRKDSRHSSWYYIKPVNGMAFSN